MPGGENLTAGQGSENQQVPLEMSNGLTLRLGKQTMISVFAGLVLLALVIFLGGFLSGANVALDHSDSDQRANSLASRTGEISKSSYLPENVTASPSAGEDQEPAQWQLDAPASHGPTDGLITAVTSTARPEDSQASARRPSGPVANPAPHSRPTATARSDLGITRLRESEAPTDPTPDEGANPESGEEVPPAETADLMEPEQLPLPTIRMPESEGAEATHVVVKMPGRDNASAKPLPPPRIPVQPQPPYTVQVGAFLDPGNADSVLQTLLQRKYPAYTLKTVDQVGRYWYRVRFGEYATLEQAIENAERFERNERLRVIIVRMPSPETST